MNDGVFIGRHLATSPNGIWLAVCHEQLSVWTNEYCASAAHVVLSILSARVSILSGSSISYLSYPSCHRTNTPRMIYYGLTAADASKEM